MICPTTSLFHGSAIQSIGQVIGRKRIGTEGIRSKQWLQDMMMEHGGEWGGLPRLTRRLRRFVGPVSVADSSSHRELGLEES